MHQIGENGKAPTAGSSVESDSGDGNGKKNKEKPPQVGIIELVRNGGIQFVFGLWVSCWSNAKTILYQGSLFLWRIRLYSITTSLVEREHFYFLKAAIHPDIVV